MTNMDNQSYRSGDGKNGIATGSIIYGPVPSRRLGRSLGINNIPPKKCSYSCIYCQLGRTVDMQITRQAFYSPVELAGSVSEKVRQLRERNEPVDYLAFVPDGEPTLDIHLGQAIELLKNLEIKVAVITNASLIGSSDVRQDLMKADWVCLKTDAVTQEVWKKVDRPHKTVKLDCILNGMLDFSSSFRGELTTGTMLVGNGNESEQECEKIADFLASLKPAKAFLSIPTRPPAERIEQVTEHALNTAFQIFTSRSLNVEYLIGYEGNAFASTGNAVDDIVSITAVHPMREDAVTDLLKKTGGEWSEVRKLIDEKVLVELEYLKKKFYARKIPGKTR
jgi:wyosine [tRNA(Phe)-imidazoG37] synthetase (radical SAM superfamily)